MESRYHGTIRSYRRALRVDVERSSRIKRDRAWIRAAVRIAIAIRFRASVR
jgi:hypothetical protein